MRTFFLQVFNYIKSNEPSYLLFLANDLIQSNDEDQWTKIETIAKGAAKDYELTTCQNPGNDLDETNKKLKSVLIKVILWHRLADVYEMDDDFTIKVNDRVYPVFKIIYNSCGRNYQQALLARMLVDFYKENPERQEEIKALIVAQAEIDYFYGDPRSPAQKNDFAGSECEILSEIVDIASIALK